jgi:N,N'-diacetyllegionaminate synthase
VASSVKDARADGPILFLVPARGGSRRVPGKNLRLVGGIPLVGRAVRTARLAAMTLAGGPHVVACSTDDPDIAGAARTWGATVIDRPAELADDTATSVDVALHALEVLGPVGDGPNGFRTLVLVQPTSPLLEAADLIRAMERHRSTGGRSVVAVVAGHPAAWHYGADADDRLHAASGVHGMDRLLAGAFYVVGSDVLRDRRRFVEPGETIGLPLPAERAVDVDEEHDLVAADAMLGARPVRPVPVGDLVAGQGRLIVIAEAGVNHDGDIDIALRLVDAAAAAGADVVKFQTFDPVALAAAGAPTAEYQRRAGVEAGGQRELLARLALPDAAWRRLADHAAQMGIVFMSTPFDDRSADLLDALGVPAFKIGSGELTNTPFLARVAARGRPMLVSTGMADMVEVAAAVDTIRAAGDPPLALFHCVSAYPATPADANLRAMETMRRAFDTPVGWSDHTLGVELPLAAAAMGAALVEKHLTLDRTRQGPDHAASLEPADFGAMVAGIRAVEAARGTGVKAPVEAEGNVAAVARRSLHWARAMAAGDTVRAADLVALRPGVGLRPALAGELAGRRVTRAVDVGTMVALDDLETGS